MDAILFTDAAALRTELRSRGLPGLSALAGTATARPSAQVVRAGRVGSTWPRAGSTLAETRSSLRSAGPGQR